MKNKLFSINSWCFLTDLTYILLFSIGLNIVYFHSFSWSSSFFSFLCCKRCFSLRLTKFPVFPNSSWKFHNQRSSFTSWWDKLNPCARREGVSRARTHPHAAHENIIYTQTRAESLPWNIRFIVWNILFHIRC